MCIRDRSWLIEDSKKDKSSAYGYDLPKGTWMVSMKVLNDEVWKAVKDGEVKGFSIEGYFADNMERPKESIEEEATFSWDKCEKCENEDGCEDCIKELKAQKKLEEIINKLT